MAEVTEYTVFDPAGLDGFFTTATGLRVTAVGDYGDLLVLGHVDDDAAWTALRAWRRHYDGEDLGDGDRGEVIFEQRFAVFANHHLDCDAIGCSCFEDEVCGPCKEARHGECSDTTEGVSGGCECRSDLDHDVPAGRWPCGCECCCDEYGWWVSTTTAGEPVTWVRIR